MEQSSQPIKPVKKCEKPNKDSEMDRLARQWAELMLEVLQHKKDMNKKKD